MEVKPYHLVFFCFSLNVAASKAQFVLLLLLLNVVAFLKNTTIVYVCVCVCFCMCVCLHSNSKSNQSRNIHFESIVEYENSWYKSLR